jgi:transcriptional regulator with GAF, ATPase, and Fis domain/Tfp pilus assembly protein PilF
LLLERSSGAPETATLIELYWILGRSSTLSGDPVSAARAFDRALEIATAAGQAIWLATTYSGLCMVHQMRGDLQESVRLARASVALLEDAGDPDLLSFTHNALGNALLAVCSWEEALVWYQQAAEWAEHAEDRARLSTTLGNMGLTHLNLGDWDLAEEYLERSLALARELGHAYSMELGYGNTGFLLTRRGALGEAGDSLHEAIALAQTCGDEWGLAVVLSNLGELEQLRGNVVVALEHYARSEQLMARVGCVDDLPELLRRRATSLLRLGRHAEALDSATRARGMASEMGNILEGANSSRVLAEIASSQGRGDEAARLCEEAIEKLEGIGAKYELGLALAARGRIGLAVGDSEEGGRFLKRAEQIFVELGARRDARIVQEELTQIDSGSIVPPSGLPEERQRLASLYKSSRSLAAAGSVESLLQELADISAANVHADTAAAVLLLPPDAATAAPSTICELRESPESLYSLVSSVLAERPEGDAAAVIRERSSGAGPLSRAKGIKCCVVAPMVAGGCTVGALYLDYRRRDGEFSDQDTRFLEALAAQGATAIENMQLRGRLEDEVEYLRWEVDGRCSFSNIIGQSLEMQRLYSVLQKVARSSVTVLIEGESGTGKELVARALHYDGPRKKARFVAQNCAALPEQLLESELFGHVRGAFTGALRDKTGLFEAADGGTFFLDEIADMPPSLQVKLLRVLQDGEVRRVGATDPTSVDVRIIAATNKSLEDEVKSGRFREDLYYRLNVVRLVMPPLRDRRDDIPLLAQHFLNKVSAGMDRPQTGFSDAAMDLLINYDWPGNVRELENEIERAVALSEPGAGITARVLSDRIRSVQVIVRPPRPGDRTSLKDLIDDVEKRVILQVLNEHNWNKSRTAEALGLSRQGLLKKIARLGLRPEEE